MSSTLQVLWNMWAMALLSYNEERMVQIEKQIHNLKSQEET